jgi:hypothetical protein
VLRAPAPIFTSVKSVKEDAPLLANIRKKYSNVGYYISSIAIFLMNEMINHRSRTLLFLIAQLIIGINILDTICLKPE